MLPCHFTVLGGDAYKSNVIQHPPIGLRLGRTSHALYNPQYKKSTVIFFLPMIMYGEVWPHLQGIDFLGEI